MSKPGLNFVNNEAIFNQKHTLKLFIPFKMANSGSFSLGEILIFQNSSKKIYNINRRDQYYKTLRPC